MPEFPLNPGNQRRLMIEDSYKLFLKEMEVFPKLQSLRKILAHSVNSAFNPVENGNLIKWLGAYEQLPKIQHSTIDLACSVPRIGKRTDFDDSSRNILKATLKELHPWRKGPYDLFGIHIDTEWRSDFKWDRLKNNISNLKNRLVLDIGCGNGYHCLRMIGEDARLVVGIDPGMLSVVQFKALQKYMGSEFKVQGSEFRSRKSEVRGHNCVDVFPLGVEDLPESIEAFDTVFSMGVIYHRKDPLEHLQRIKSFLRPGGEVVMETLVIDGNEEDVLHPEGRYAQMRNVWQIPSPLSLEKWMKDVGFCDIRTIDVTTTTIKEQHSTEWMKFHSLAEFLDPQDNTKTVEEYPAPKRAIVIAEK
jgi:tRNA (mo5U34)-methyltransferase